MTELLDSPPLRGKTDTELAELYEAASDEERAALLAEMDRRDRADRMAVARKRLAEIRAEGYDASYAQYLEADAWTRGNLLSDLGKRKVTDEISLWSGDEATAMRYASEELRDYWLFVAPRITPGSYARQKAAERRGEHDEADRSDERNASDEHEHDRDTGQGLGCDEASGLQPGPAVSQAPEGSSTAGPVRPDRRCPGEDAEGPKAGSGDGGSGGPVRPVAREDGDMPEPEPQPSGPEPPVTIPYGTFPLDEARQFAGEILWAPDYMLDALTLACAASHVLDTWATVPRLLATSPEGKSGKTTLLDVVRLLAAGAWEATGATSYSLKAKFNEPERPFILVDEVSDIFGTSGRAGAGSPVGLVARNGYRRTATVSMSVNRTSEDIPAFCFMAMGGLKTAVPPDIRSRCIEFRMRPVPQTVTMRRDSLDPDTEGEAVMVRSLLHTYMRAMLAPGIRKLQRRHAQPHPKFRDRLAQIWGPLYLTAKAADMADEARWEQACRIAEANGDDLPEPPACDWERRALTAFKAMALDASDLPALTPAQAMLRDTATYIRGLVPGPEFVAAADVRDWLRDSCDEQLWSTLTDRRLAILMVEGLGPNAVRARPDDPTVKARGWYCREVLAKWDALERALTPPVATVPDEDESSLFDDLPGEGNSGNTSVSAAS